MRYHVLFEGHASAGREGRRPPDSDVLEQELNRIMEALLHLQVADATVGGTLARGEIQISATLEAGSLEDATERGSTLIQDAIRMSHGPAEGWSVDWVSVRATKMDEPEPRLATA